MLQETLQSIIDAHAGKEGYEIIDQMTEEYKAKVWNKVTIDTKGHFGFAEPIPTDSKIPGTVFIIGNIEDCLSSIVHTAHNMKNILPETDQHTLPNLVSACSTTRLTCNECGESVRFRFDSDTLVCSPIDEERCSYEHTDKTQSIQLDIPSGKVVIVNDMRRIVGEDEHAIAEYFQDGGLSYPSIASRHGRILNTEYWATRNIMYFQAGNSSYDYVWNPETNTMTFMNGEEEPDNTLGTISTNLWAVQAMDHDLFSEYCIEQSIDVEDALTSIDGHVVGVPKGTYTCTTYFEHFEDGESGTFYTMQLNS